MKLELARLERIVMGGRTVEKSVDLDILYIICIRAFPIYVLYTVYMCTPIEEG